MYIKHCQIKKWLVLYFTSKNNDSLVSKYLDMDILEHFNQQFRLIQLPNKYYIKIILNSNLETLLHEELDYFTLFINFNDINEPTIKQNDRYINKQLDTIFGKCGENMRSNYKINRSSNKLNILVPSHKNELLSIRDYNKNTKLNSKLINNMELIYRFYDENNLPFLLLTYKLNSKSDKFIKPDGIYQFEYTTELSYTKIDMKLIYLTIPHKIKLY